MKRLVLLLTFALLSLPVVAFVPTAALPMPADPEPAAESDAAPAPWGAWLAPLLTVAAEEPKDKAEPKPHLMPGNCKCGCVDTGKCNCKDCDHPKGKDPTPPCPNCQCGCTETGKCFCVNCDSPATEKPKDEPKGKPTKQPAPAPASAPSLKIDAEVKPNGQYVNFLPDTDCVSVMFVGLDGIDPLPSAILKDARMFVLDTRGMAQGRYRFAAVGSAKDGQQVRADFAVAIGTPTPKPPDPPAPSDLTKTLQAAYTLDTDSDRVASLAFLQSAFKGMAASAALHLEWKTNADAMAWEKSVAEAPGVGLKPITDPKAQVVNLRKAIGAALLAELGDDKKAADPAAIAAGFKRVSDALGGVK